MWRSHGQNADYVPLFYTCDPQKYGNDALPQQYLHNVFHVVSVNAEAQKVG